MTNWHNCDGQIACYLHQVLKPPAEWNGGKPSWAMLVGPRIWLPVAYCPICGERLERGQNTDNG